MERVLTLVLLCSLFAMGQMMPEDVREVSVTYRTETELTLQWETVNSSYSYKLERDGVKNELINGTEPGLVTHKVSNLSSGTLYSFTLYTVFEEKQSTGFPFSNVTAPSNAANVSVTNRNETEMTLLFEKAGHSSNYTYELEHKVKQTLKCTTRDSFVVCEVKALSPGTEYSFTLYTVFEGVRSSGYNFTSVTVPSDVANVSVTDRKETEMTLKWDKVNNNDIYTYELEYNGERHQTDLVEYTVKDLSSGTQYFFTLYTVFENVTSNGYNFTNVTVPSDVASVSVTDRKETEMTLKWDKVNNNDSYTYELEYNGERHQTGIKVEYTVKDLSSGTQYFFTLYTVFENVTSNGYNFTNVTVPSKVENLGLAKGNDTDVILQWDKTKEQKDKTYEYTLEFSNNSYENITVTTVENKIMCHISGLIPATNYTFTVYTNFFDARSTGVNYSHTTTLSRVTNIRVTRSLTELNITWNKLNNNSIYNYTLCESERLLENFIGSHMDAEKTYRYQKLTPGKVYSFKLDTVVHDARNSSSFKNITTLDCESFKWNVTNSSISAQVNGSTEVKAVNSSSNTNIAPVTNNKVDLQGLYPGATYNVSLLYVLDTQTHEQCSHSLTLDPNSVPNLRCEYFSGGYGLAVSWDQPHGVVDVVQVDVGKRSFNRTSNDPRLEVKDLQAAQWYKVTATSFSKAKKSQTESLNCQTNPAGVIAGVLVFFLLIILICAAVYFWRRYRSAKHNKSSSRLVEPKVTNKSYKLIPVDKFPEYFQNMSCDENRGFSEEYEDLSSVGIEQSSAAALLPKNKDKNRFTNVLPYDSTRVQLTVNDEDDSDYINANYMPGYGNGRKEYIAAQGPLPYTVNDFWRMIWDKRSQVIVMVTNCTESGRVKCEQYWPLDFMPCLYGNLVVTVKSENKARSWTLREFDVKNKSTSETRIVKHFHFTAWPDHGVPSGTEELIKFRGLVRQHIESSSSEGPTVVHCSAGVGRTGTLIALDVLLQQLDREKAVGIAAFVQQMRFCRPLMVQTESQYVFLHQCIMDSLQTKVMAASEPLYENSDMIYVNAIALRQYENGSQI